MLVETRPELASENITSIFTVSRHTLDIFSPTIRNNILSFYSNRFSVRLFQPLILGFFERRPLLVLESGKSKKIKCSKSNCSWEGDYKERAHCPKCGWKQKE